MDAEKVKKRLNGSILKGTKVRIEKARPQKEPSVEKEEPKPKPERTKRKRDTITGAEIGDRSVKRGWTEPGSQDKKKIKSKYTTGAECLFKTVLPPNVAASTDGKADKKQRKETVVHEFSKTTKYATFLRGNAVVGKKGVAEFVEGKGWVDEEGNVVEEVKKSKKKPKVEVKAVVEDKSEDSSSEDESEVESNVTSLKVPLKPAQEDESSDGSSSDEEATPVASSKAISTPEADSDTSTSGSSEESDSDSESSSDSSEDEPSPSPISSLPISRPQSSSASGPPPNLSIQIPPSATSPITTIHPLEALYRKSQPTTDATPKPTAPSFSFFGADDDENTSETDDLPTHPLTPFTQRDFEYRGLRSAAPTPDTAHANKRFIWPTETEDDEDDVAPSSPLSKEGKGKKKEKGEKIAKVKDEGTAPESDFQKWFYEHRGETTRAWKKRRRVAAKEKRHRENKKRESRAV